MKKSFVAIILVLVMAFFTVPAFAANGITPEEQAVLDKFAAGREIEGVQVTPFAKYITVSENFLIRNDLDADDIQRVSDCIDYCYDILEAEKVTSFRQMKNSPRLHEVVEAVDELAHTFNGWIEFNYDNGDVVVKQTGFNLTATILVAVGVVAAAGAAIVIANRKKLFAKAA